MHENLNSGRTQSVCFIFIYFWYLERLKTIFSSWELLKASIIKISRHGGPYYIYAFMTKDHWAPTQAPEQTFLVPFFLSSSCWVYPLRWGLLSCYYN